MPLQLSHPRRSDRRSCCHRIVRTVSQGGCDFAFCRPRVVECPKPDPRTRNITLSEAGSRALVRRKLRPGRLGPTLREEET
jgi:hypothetical protein